MAQASWLNVTPSQGNGDATVNVSSTSELPYKLQHKANLQLQLDAKIA